MGRSKNTVLYSIWAAMYIGGLMLSLLENVQGVALVLLWIYGVAFFVPGGILAARAIKAQEKKQLKLLRILSGASLGLTVAGLVASFVSVNGSAQLGEFFHGFLMLVSVPMPISYSWALSLFLWACLLITTLPGVIVTGKWEEKK